MHTTPPNTHHQLRGSLLALLLLAGCTGPGNREPGLLVTVDTGSLEGVRADGVAHFRGIPYAASPDGKWRWRPPRPATRWTGVRPAQDYGPTCAQPDSKLLWFKLENTSEDCLTLNITTPDIRPAAPLPVMVWIHGGGFSQGSGNLPQLNGTALPKQGIVVVTINYRLAMFGFLAHPALARPGEPVGNYGLLDAVAALQWVQRNIAAFGGDPARVTIFGESAGADAVNHLLVMPAAKGLFTQAISQSSSVGMAPEPLLRERAGFNPPAEEIARNFIAKLGLPPGADLATALRALPTAELLAAMGERDRFAPIVDGETIPQQVGRLFAAGRQHPVRYLTGGNSWEASLGRSIGGGFSPAFAARLVPAADKARLYPGLSGDTLDDAIFGDLIILANSRYLANRMREQGMPVHAYYFSYVADDRRATQPGAAHADDIPFVMGTLDTGTGVVSRRDRAISRLMTRYWAQFAKTGDPNGAGLPEWPAYERESARVLELGDEVRIRDGLFRARMDYHLQRGEALLRATP
ncbi:MAG: carboxylesterase family protein [Gammaproteobacteria bacterium]